MPPFPVSHAAVAALLAIASADAALATPPPDRGEAGLAAADVPQLQGWYLGCDRASRTALLDLATARSCSVVAEALLQRGFGGDFDRLLAWWRAQRELVAATPGR